MISLINPSASVEVVRRLGISTPPLGLGYIASVLRKRGFKVRIIDDMVEKLSPNELIKRVKDSFIVGITSTTPTFNSALEYAKVIKERLPNIFIILGGVHASVMPYDAIKSKWIDAICVGEGEFTLEEVAERLEDGKPLEGVKGVIYKEGNRIVDNGRREFIENLDSLPFPSFDLMPLERYTVLGQKLRQFPVITSRGCPFSCRYCSSSLFLGRRFRARSPKNVADEVEWLVNELNAKQIAFGDDIFTLNKRRVVEICDEIVERGIEIDWSCSSRVDTISAEMLEKMKSAGCVAIYYGIESASDRTLNYYRKRIDLERAQRAVKLTKKAGIQTICSFIIGSPYETKEDMKRTLKLALRLNPDYAQFSILTPYPGTEIYTEAKRKGLLLTSNFDEYTAGKPVLRNLYLSPQEIMRFLRYCYLRFYLSPKFILNQIKKGRIGTIVDVLRRITQKD
jgi:radical SAM superfamily enzyme YgiQ (UPF0313 family)